MLALYIILGIIAFIIAVLSVSFVLKIEYTDSVSIDVNWLFLQFQILPEKEKKKKKNKKQSKNTDSDSSTVNNTENTAAPPDKSETPQKSSDKNSSDNRAQNDSNSEKQTVQLNKSDGTSDTTVKKGFISKLKYYEGITGLIELINDLASELKTGLGKTFRTFVIRELYFYITVAGKDSASTAIKYGRICAAVFPSLGKICTMMKVKKYDIDISPDFLANKGKTEVRAVISVRPLILINSVVVMGIRFLYRYLKAKLSIDKK